MNEMSYTAGVPESRLRWSTLLTETYRLYRRHFWSLFRAALPPAILAYAWQYIWQLITRLWLRPWRLGLGSQMVEWPAAGFLRDGAYWCLSAFFFAAVASQILEEDQEAAPLVSDVYSKARLRIGPVMMVALIAWTLFFVGKLTFGAAMAYLFYRLGALSSYWSGFTVFAVILIILGGLLSRFGLAIPGLMCDLQLAVRGAIRNSLQKTENWEVFFMLFLIKSAILGYAAYRLVDLALVQLWRHSLISNSVYGWVAWALYLCIGAMLESPLFIAFSLLYRESRSKQEDALTAPAIG